MNFHTAILYAQLVTGLSVIAMCILRWQRTDIGGRLFAAEVLYDLCTGTLFYSCAHFPAVSAHLKPLNDFFNAVSNYFDFIFFGIFYNFSIPQFRKKKLWLYLVLATCLYWLINYFVFKAVAVPNSYFLAISSLGCILLSLTAIYYMMEEEDFTALLRKPVFCFVLLILGYYGTTFFFWLCYDFFTTNAATSDFTVTYAATMTNLFFIGAALAYTLYPKKTILNAR